MPHLTGPLAAALLLAGFAGAPLSAQELPSALAAIDQVMGFRRDVVDDATPFDACRVFEHGGRPADFPAQIREGIRPLLDRLRTEPCAAAAGDPNRLVSVDSVVRTDSMAYVHLSVRRGEWSFTETYSLSLTQDRRGWGVREARIGRALRVHRRRTGP